MNHKPTCVCCGKIASYFVSGYVFNPTKPDGRGREFTDPACRSFTAYLEEASAELNLPFTKTPVPEESTP